MHQLFSSFNGGDIELAKYESNPSLNKNANMT